MRKMILALGASLLASALVSTTASAQDGCVSWRGGMCGQDTRIGLGAMLYRGLGGGGYGAYGPNGAYGQNGAYGNGFYGRGPNRRMMIGSRTITITWHRHTNARVSTQIAATAPARMMNPRPISQAEMAYLHDLYK